MRKTHGNKCTVKAIRDEIGELFIERYHRQSIVKSVVPIYIGLFLKDELIGVVLFGNPRNNREQKSYSRELQRICFKEDVQVQNGVSKLINYYIVNYNPNDFFICLDVSEKNSTPYENCGMKLVEDRIRKNNNEISAEDLSCSIKETPEGLVYEWINPNLSFYVYKITSVVDDGYYIGRRRICKKDATIQDCIDDTYMGSGGVKFKNWVNKVGKKNLRKEILHIVKTKKE